jgi:ethanolamine ammonia-lyase small subunit
MTANKPPVTPSRWDALRRFTDARIALGRAGHSLPTGAHLAFQLAHAQARDAVHLAFDADGVAASLQGLGLSTLSLHSAAVDRATYLQRPDLGRKLDDASHEALAQWRAERSDASRFDLAFVVADGLSALAVHENAVALIAAMQTRLKADALQPWSIAPVAVVEQGRVAIGDETGDGLQANAVVVLIGERPGLSSPDSLGVYVTWAPKAGLTDANRNCISNVRSAGLVIESAANKLYQLLAQSRARHLTGVGLKDEHDDLEPVLGAGGSKNFLLDV